MPLGQVSPRPRLSAWLAVAFLLTFPLQALAAQSSASLLTDSQQSAVRGDVADILLAGCLLAVGIGSLGLSGFRSRAAAYLFLDVEANGVEYASAGHPPLLVRSGGEEDVREVRLEALPLGRFRQASYRSTSLSLAPGDRLLLYTDGVVEATNPGGEPFGEERLRDFLLTGEELPADRLADGLLERLAAWSGQPAGRALQDDVTVMVVDRLSSDALA